MVNESCRMVGAAGRRADHVYVAVIQSTALQRVPQNCVCTDVVVGGFDKQGPFAANKDG